MSIPSGCGRVMMKGNAVRKPCFLTTTASTSSKLKWRAFLIRTGRICIPRMGASSAISSCRPCGEEDLTVYGNGGQTRSFCYVDDLIDGLIALMQSPDEVVGPVEYRAILVSTPFVKWLKMVLKLTGGRSNNCLQAPAARRSDTTPTGYYGRQEHALGWEPKVPLAEKA